MGNSLFPQLGGAASFSQPAASSGSWADGNIVGDWFGHKDTFAHNEALMAFNRESAFNAAEAEKARQFERFMSDTQLQRKVSDYLKSGFSPLAALEGNGSYTVSSAPAASAHGNPARNSSNNLGALFGALLMTMASVATHGATAAASESGNAAKAALDSQKLALLKDKVDVQKGWLDLAKNGKDSASRVAAQRVLREAANGKNSPKVDWDKLLDDLDNI